MKPVRAYPFVEAERQSEERKRRVRTLGENLGTFLELDRRIEAEIFPDYPVRLGSVKREHLFGFGKLFAAVYDVFHVLFGMQGKDRLAMTRL